MKSKLSAIHGHSYLTIDTEKSQMVYSSLPIGRLKRVTLLTPSINAIYNCTIRGAVIHISYCSYDWYIKTKVYCLDWPINLFIIIIIILFGFGCVLYLLILNLNWSFIVYKIMCTEYTKYIYEIIWKSAEQFKYRF